MWDFFKCFVCIRKNYVRRKSEIKSMISVAKAGFNKKNNFFFTSK
jgi:hypothetical protein